MVATFVLLGVVFWFFLQKKRVGIVRRRVWRRFVQCAEDGLEGGDACGLGRGVLEEQVECDASMNTKMHYFIFGVLACTAREPFMSKVTM